MAAEATPRVFEPGIVLGGRYRLGARFGAGGAGQIFEAIDERLDKTVAIKVVRTPELADRASLARLEREARAAGRIRHPNIVQVTDLGETADGFPYLVMERLEGDTLDEKLEQGGPLAIATAIDVHVQLLDALAAAHEAGVLHRDIKPANVIVRVMPTGGPMVTLLDFGLAALADGRASPLTGGGVVLGSPAYIAPERLLGHGADARSDVYSVGVCLYETLTGVRPFSAPNAQVLRGKILREAETPAHERRSEVSPELSAIAARAMAKDPNERFESAAQMRDALRSVSRAPKTGAERAGERAGAERARERAGSERAQPRSRWIGPAIGLIAAGVAVGGVVVWRSTALGSNDRIAAAAPNAPVEPRVTIAIPRADAGPHIGDPIPSAPVEPEAPQPPVAPSTPPSARPRGPRHAAIPAPQPAIEPEAPSEPPSSEIDRPLTPRW